MYIVLIIYVDNGFVKSCVNAVASRFALLEYGPGSVEHGKNGFELGAGGFAGQGGPNALMQGFGPVVVAHPTIAHVLVI